MGTVKKADIIIVGSGVVGNSTAYYLSKAGLKVIVLEKYNVGYGASTRNGGINKINGRGLGEIPLCMYGANELWPNLSDELGIDVEYKRTGGFRISLSDEQTEYMYRFVEFGKKYGITFEEFDGKKLKERVPEFSEKIVAALRCDQEFRANPMKVTLGFYIKARQLGAEFICGEEVETINEKCGKAHSVTTVNGNVYEADRIMIAAGYNSRKILDTIGIDIPLYSYYEEIFVTEKIPRFIDELFIQAKVTYYGHQAENGSIIFGGASGYDNFPNREWYDDAYQTAKRLPAEARGLVDIFPFLKKVKVIRGWGGWMDISPDDSMMIGSIDEVPGLYIACGFSGHGFGMSVPTGKVMSEVILGDKLGADISNLKYNRFAKHLDMFTGMPRSNLINSVQKK
ncbi:MAG: FAD-binding oxidoreductase [Candidatus Metalachnospira sp.]|nr:FAD-binding oxidoreductase [Candidatus Metalachnospira sp.]